MDKFFNLFEKRVKTTKKTPGKELHEEVKRIVEALLFSTSEPLSCDKIKEIVLPTFPITNTKIKELIETLNEEYVKQNHPYAIAKVAGGYVFRTTPEMAPYLALLHQDRRGGKLSNAAKEVLAIIAHKEPITKAQIESLRGVDSSGTLYSLQERGLIEVTGRLNVPGRPAQWGITKKFLTHFGLEDKKHLNKVLVGQ